jgi:ABC-2 type transport system ATP-binding protein
MDSPAIELKGLQHRYDTAQVLQGINLRIEHGEVFGFLGHNGAGKTTTVNTLTTLITPTGGEASVCGFDVVRQRRQVTECIGYLPSEVRMDGHLTAPENLEFFGRSRGC